MPELAEGARKLLTPQPGEGETAQGVAERAGRICHRLTQHLARLIGEAGVNALIRRSMVLASNGHHRGLPFQRGMKCGTRLELGAVAEWDRQPRKLAAEGFVGVFTTLVRLLKRLIGEGLVDHLLAEVWPAIFPLAVEETP